MARQALDGYMKLPQSARDVTLAGSHLVEEVVQTMTGISDSAVKIADIAG